MLDFGVEEVEDIPGIFMKGTVLYIDKPPPKNLEEGDVDTDDLPNHVQKKIRALQMAIRAKRPPPPRFARRGPPPRPLPERWRPEEDELLLTLINHSFPYSQIAYVRTRFYMAGYEVANDTRRIIWTGAPGIPSRSEPGA